MQDKLSIVNKRVEESRVDITEIARRLDIDRGTVYRWLDDADISNEKIALIGFAIGYDFSIDFTELKGLLFFFKENQYRVGEPMPLYGTTSKQDIAELKTEVVSLREEVSTMHRKIDVIHDTVIKLANDRKP